MTMYRRVFYYVSVFFAMFVCAENAKAQTTDALGSFTPYSMFGVGEVIHQGTVFNRTMGGIGQGLRDHRYINYLNPAAITGRDFQAFMLDFGAQSHNTYLSDGKVSSAYNAFNMHHLVLAFPVYKRASMVLGVMPYSHVGYKFSGKDTRPEIVSEYGDVAYQYSGEGGVNQLFVGGALPINKNFSVGAQGIFYFGAIERRSNVLFSSASSLSSLLTGYDAVLGSFTGKFGLQYMGVSEKGYFVSAGASYLLGTNLGGDLTRYAYSTMSSLRDTLYMETTDGAGMEIPSEFAMGFAFGQKAYERDGVNKWMIGFDYSRQDWSKAAFAATPGVNFSPTVSSSFKMGLEITPDRYDIRYFLRRWTYRAGAYYEQSYMKLNGQQVNAYGITLGVSIPIFQLSNMVNFGVDFGKRGMKNDGLVRENYVMFHLGVSLYDIWFRKYRYD